MTEAGVADARLASLCGRQSNPDGTPPRVFFLFIGRCDCFSPSDPYQSRCVQDPIDPTRRVRHANRSHWTRCLAAAKRRPNMRKKPPPENADDGALVGTLALTPDDPKHELACRSLWTLKDDVPPLSDGPIVCRPAHLRGSSVDPQILSLSLSRLRRDYECLSNVWLYVLTERQRLFARSCMPT